MTWIGLVLRNLRRRPARSFCTMLGVALAVGSFLTLAGFSRGMSDAAHASLGERGIDLIVIKRGMLEFFSSSLPESLGQKIDRIPGVSAVSPELASLMPLGEERHALVVGWRPDSFEWRTTSLIRGRLPKPGEKGVLLGDALAELLHADIGSKVALSFFPFRVTGIAAFSNILNRGIAIMPLADMQEFLARPDQVTMFNIRLDRPDDPAAVHQVQTAISELRPDISVSTTEELLRSNRAVQILGRTSGVVAAVALAVASLSVLNTLAMAVEERTREIGILAAIGWGRRRILGLILGEGLLLAGLGGLLGMALGWLGWVLLDDLVARGSAPSLERAVGLLAVSVATGLGLGAVGAFWPAWRAARLDPAAAFRRQ